MTLLTQAEVDRLGRRLHDGEFSLAALALRTTAEEALARPVLVPPAGIAGWNHNYVCPDHAVALAFSWESPHAHRCPVDGREYRSPLLDAAWWRRVNTEAMNAALATALLWRATGEQRYLERCRAILVAYAERYPGYQIHGGIPFNGPGKANQQTLCEATWIIPLAWAYDLVGAALPSAYDALIREQLLAEAGAFLVAHQEEQLHNHQCWIAAAIGILGLVLDRSDFVDTALNGEWGLYRQLRDGVLADGFWLEGSVGYHLHALTPLLKFVQTARGRLPELQHHPSLRAMLSALRPLVQPDGTFPALNDVTTPQSLTSLVPHLEIAYGWSGEPLYGLLLQEALGGGERRTLEGLLFGRDRVEPGPVLPDCGHYSSPGNGVSILRENGLYLLVKHGDGGQEHDHSDRLGLSLVGRGQRLAPDVGTVLYGHPMHWDWYKSTLAHNTILIGGQNQPPGKAGVSTCTESGDGALLDTWAAWPADAPGGYAGARFRRIILWAPDCFVDVCHVQTARPHRIEYLFHSPGELDAPAGWGVAAPYRFLSDCVERPASSALHWRFPKADLQARFWCGAPTVLITGRSPDNPPDRQRSTLILRQDGQREALFVGAFRVAAEPVDLSVTEQPHGSLSIACGTYRWQVQL